MSRAHVRSSNDHDACVFAIAGSMVSNCSGGPKTMLTVPPLGGFVSTADSAPERADSIPKTAAPAARNATKRTWRLRMADLIDTASGAEREDRGGFGPCRRRLRHSSRPKTNGPHSRTAQRPVEQSPAHVGLLFSPCITGTSRADGGVASASRAQVFRNVPRRGRGCTSHRSVPPASRREVPPTNAQSARGPLPSELSCIAGGFECHTQGRAKQNVGYTHKPVTEPNRGDGIGALEQKPLLVDPRLELRRELRLGVIGSPDGLRVPQGTALIDKRSAGPLWHSCAGGKTAGMDLPAATTSGRRTREFRRTSVLQWVQKGVQNRPCRAWPVNKRPRSAGPFE